MNGMVKSLKGELPRVNKTVFEDMHVVKIQKGKYGPRGMPGDIVELKDGNLLMCYTSITPWTLNSMDDWRRERLNIVGRVSADKGRTWSEQFFLVPNPQPPSKKGYYCHPSFLRLTNGDILLSCIYSINGAVPHYGHNYYKRSSDEGVTWSEQFIMTPSPGYNIMHNDKLVQLSTGRIIAPVEYKARWPSTKDHSSYIARVFYSDDDGYRWQKSKNDVDMDPHEAQEPHIVELKDGRLMMIFRTYSGFVGRAYSMDQGETWSRGELVKELNLSPYAGAVTVNRIPSTGDLLLIRATGGKEGKRSPLTATISQDEGKTWIHSRNIADDPDDDYGYQSVTFVDNMAVISYHALDGLHVARIGIDWFYGKG